MKTYDFEGYKLLLHRTEQWGPDGKRQIMYSFTNPADEILFSGKDFYIPNHIKPESKEAAIQLLGFLTLREGDTDADWFDNYTPAQLQFSRSQDCENLQSIVYDYENAAYETGEGFPNSYVQNAPELRG